MRNALLLAVAAIACDAAPATSPQGTAPTPSPPINVPPSPEEPPTAVALKEDDASPGKAADEPAEGEAKGEAKGEAEAEAEAEEALKRWNYSVSEDEMTGKKTYIARVLSEEEYELDFPYQGGTWGRLMLRHHPRHGTDVMISINSGQLHCGSFRGCKILVRFDDGEPVKFSASPPADYSHDTLFITPAAKFIKAVKTASKVRVELPFFQQGSRMFTFQISELVWNH